jgi:hypothetical protein
MTTTHHSSDEFCPHCHTLGSVRRPHRGWMVALSACWAYGFVATFAVGNIGPFIMIVLPFFLFGTVALITEVHARATAEPQCDVCGKIVVAGTELLALPVHEDLRHAA